ncbi:MAG: hypothetical protein CM1200mP18_10550 [Gammaproteobacteria bacterium]|nr:MAG: hypothetical protein CM1200mP18_10550 [Gammaproteobacteria bacterium]
MLGPTDWTEYRSEQSARRMHSCICPACRNHLNLLVRYAGTPPFPTRLLHGYYPFLYLPSMVITTIVLKGTWQFEISFGEIHFDPPLEHPTTLKWNIGDKTPYTGLNSSLTR